MDRDLRIRVILTKLGDLVGPLKAIGNQSKVTTDGLRATQAQLKALHDTQNNIASFRQLKTQLGGTTTELAAAQARVDGLAKAYTSAEKPTKKLTAEFAKAKKYAGALKAQHAEQSAALQGLRDKLRAAGVSTRDLAANERTLRGDLARTTDQLTAQKKALADIAQADRRRADNSRRLDRTRSRASTMAVGGAATLGTGLAILAPLQTAVGVASEFQATMTSIALKTGLSRQKTDALGRSLASLSPRVNQLPTDLAEGADILASFGLNADAIPKMLLPASRAATAYKAEISDLARASFSVVDNLKLPFDQTSRAIDIMAEAGKRGSFELKDMAQYFPALAASAQGLGQTGAPAVADLAAALQIVRKGTGESSVAATNLQNLLAKITTTPTTKAFAKFGIDLPKALKKMYAEGKTPIEAITELTSTALKGDMSQLPKLFEDMQVQQALRPLVANLALYRDMRREALNATGTVEADYARRLLDAEESSKRLKVMTESLQIKLGTALIPTVIELVENLNIVIDRVTAWSDANPELARWLAIIAGTIGVILLITGSLAVAVAGILGPFALLRYAMVALAPAAWALATAVWAAALPFLPFIAAAAGLIAIGIAIYNHWDELAAFFSTLGTAIMDGFVNGVVDRWNRIKSVVTGIADKVASTFKNALGIRSPSRLFAGYGHNLMAGLANGIDGNVAAPVARVQNASRAITAALAIGASIASPATARSTAAPPASAATGAASASHTINIYPAPGQSPQDIAKAVAAELDKRERTRSAAARSSLGDYGE